MARKPGAIGWQHLRLLGVVARNAAITSGELADALGLERSAVSRLTGMLSRRGYLVRAHPRGDLRAVSFTMTAKGRAIIQEAADSLTPPSPVAHVAEAAA